MRADLALRPVFVAGVAASVLVVWLAWFVLGRVGVYEVTPEARIEVAGAAHPVDAEVDGRLEAVHAVVGEAVRVGDVLFELSSQEQWLMLEEQRATHQALELQLESLLARSATEDEVVAATEEEGAAALDRARADLDEAEAAATYAEREYEYAAELRAAGHISESEVRRLQAEALGMRAAAEAARAEVVRLTWAGQIDFGDRTAGRLTLEGEIARFEGQVAAAQAAVARLEEAIEKRRVKAPISGIVAEVAGLATGAVVAAGTRLATVVPPGELHVVALCDPGGGLGRIAAGQPGRMRLHGFPWTQYGSLPLTVRSVSAEPRDGRLRVELDIDDPTAVDVPLRHGMPGAVEIRVERRSPLVLALRIAGRRLGSDP